MSNKTQTQVIPELVAYLDGELSERDQSQVAAALRGSSHLQQETARLERVGLLVRTLSRLPVRELCRTFWQRLEHEGQIEEESPIARWQRNGRNGRTGSLRERAGKNGGRVDSGHRLTFQLQAS